MTGFFYITGYMFGMACFPLGCGISEDTPGMAAFYFHGRLQTASRACVIQVKKNTS